MYLLLTEEVAKGKLNNICFIHDWCDKITNVYERSVEFTIKTSNY